MMKNNLFLKFTLRQPVRSFLLFALIGLMSFAFVMNAVEFIVVQRELQRLGDTFPPVAFLTSTDIQPKGHLYISTIGQKNLIGNTCSFIKRNKNSEITKQSRRIANLKIFFLFFEIIKKPFTFAQSIIYQILFF